METINEVVALFISHCKFEKHLSAKTVESYSIDLRQFREFLTKLPAVDKILDVDKDVLKGYIEFLSNYKPRTIKRKIATLKAVFNFLEFDEKISSNPFRKIKIKIRDPRTLPKVMDLNEIKAILSTAYQERRDTKYLGGDSYAEKCKNVAIIELLFSTGIRVSELVNLKLTTIQMTTGSLKVLGKGNKERIIQICNQEALDSISLYHSLFKARIDSAGGYFFVNRLNRPVSDQSVRNMIKKYATRAGISGNITPHTFRHSFATLLLERDVDIKYIQHFLGHSSITTTQIYTHVNHLRQRQILSEKHPRLTLKMD